MGGDVVDVEEPNGRSLGASGTAEDPIHVERNGGDVPLGLLVRLVGLSFLGYVVVSLSIGGYLLNQQHDARFKDQQELARTLASHNESLTRRLNREQRTTDQKIQRTVADLCANAELRDTVIANQSRAIVALLREIPDPPETVLNLINASQDGINTLEPKNEKDCPLPPEGP